MKPRTILRMACVAALLLTGGAAVTAATSPYRGPGRDDAGQGASAQVALYYVATNGDDDRGDGSVSKAL
jgi:hypothetical protein